MKKYFLALFAVSHLGLLSSFATNDLVITSFARTADCTTLKWQSHTGEFYTVYATEDLRAPIRWRVAAPWVASGGTNTTWQEGCCGVEFAMMSRAASDGGASLSKQEFAALLESAQARAEEGIKFLTEKLQGATNRSAVKSSGTKSSGESASLSSAPSLGGGETNTNGVVTFPTARFFRVAKVSAGFIDGWGHVAGEFPEGTNFVAVAAGWYDSGTHSLALRADGTMAAWGNNFYGQTKGDSRKLILSGCLGVQEECFAGRPGGH